MGTSREIATEKKPEITQLLNWQDLYNSNQLENIYISWNPSIHNCRKSIHFTLHPEPISSESMFDNSLINNYKKVQILISLSPHSEPNETRLILEKHRSELNGILYEIRYNLYAFNRHRISLPTECFKTLEIREDDLNDVINDTMIFEQNNIQDNYILTVEAIPLAYLNSVFPEKYKYRNSDDPLCAIKAPKKNKRFIDCDVDEFGITDRWVSDILMSLNIFAWYETEIMEIPFKEVTQLFKMHIPSVKDQKFKLKILKPCDIEIRVEGDLTNKFAIKVSKFSRYRNSYRDNDFSASANNNINQTKNIYLAQNNGLKKKGNSIRFRGKEGTFLVGFDVRACGSKNNGYEEEIEALLDHIYEKQVKDNITISVLAFGKELHKNYQSSMIKIKKAPLYRQKTTEYKIESRFFEHEKFKFELPQKGGLNKKKVLKSEWTVENNFGDNKFGILSFQKFHQNPGFMVSVKEDCQIQITVQVDNYKDKKCDYKFNIFEIKDNYELENILDYDEFISEKKIVTDTLFLSKNKNGYLFLMIALYTDFTSPFSITINSDVELASVKDNSNGICKLPWVEQFEGSIEGNCGGWIKMHNFLLNQSFIIILGDSAPNSIEELFIELSSHNKTHHIGVSIISLNSLKSLCFVEEDEIETVRTNPAFLAEMNAYYLKLPQGIYMIIPTSFEPLESAEKLEYLLKIYSSVGFKFKKMPAFRPLQQMTQSITMVDQAIFQVDLFTESSQLMIILESIESENETVQVLDFIAGKSFLFGEVLLIKFVYIF